MIDIKTGAQLHTGESSTKPKLGYQILTADTATKLADVVNRAIGDGWCPSGGVAVALSESNDYKYMVWAQAVVRSG